MVSKLALDSNHIEDVFVKRYHWFVARHIIGMEFTYWNLIVQKLG